MSDTNVNVNVTEDNLKDTSNFLLSLQSVAEFQADLNAAVQKFGKANDKIATNVLMPVILDTFLLYPWTWIVDGFKHSPDDFEAAIKQAATLFKVAMSLKPQDPEVSTEPDEEVQSDE